ncbi:uncharacterized protein LOC112500077 isoform X4 [Cynara cardunculus var. scolymus]|uniref:uncharacterized protein LOC112500077 isoform X4 n=1 Tax=Cynara cardunculus var. scolymus TaxID=59895 RepID=UPI000D6314A7|nr:uncharacterized protein LOC112500077 isoform X4 [Cynara cardunculus var. scolymus]
MDQPDVVRYPLIHLHDYEPKIFPPKGSEGVNEYSNGGGSCDPRTEEMPVLEAKKTKTIVGSRVGSDTHEDSNDDHEKKESENFYYDPPITEDTGVWIPVSVPPMSESQREEWNRGIRMNTNYIRDVDMDWDQFVAEDKELTMWDVVLDMLLAAGGRVRSITSGDSYAYQISWLSDQLLEHTWKEVSHNLTEVNAGGIRELLEADPPKWLADSAAAYCMLCNVRFHPIMCSRHHCRFCGGIFCNECSKGRSLLPIKFRHENPQRVCDVCCVRLESIQPYLMEQVSRAVQVPTQDVTDLSTLRSWLNFPWGQTMEYEIYKAANTIHGYFKVGGEVMDFIIVLRNSDAVKTFGGNAHLSVGAGASAAAGIVGRAAEADFRAGDGGYAACYTYSCSKGAFVGCSVEGSIVTTRTQENCRFYGNPSIKTSDILLGSLPRPPAAAILYDALSKLYMKVGRR